ncbi:DUF2516 family protein [Streptomyces sp. NPDC017520]|uniref:DUF2516 family protein n=1 Tax=Streptomyces sp. NPDC017520 TaxID=3364998 RepID=UPI00378AF4F0
MSSPIHQLFNLAMLVLAVIAFVFAATAREDAYRAADKKQKPFWLLILGIAVVIDLLTVMSLFSMLFLQLAGVVASIVFMVDVRPALKAVSGGGGGGRSGGSSSDGPYGPYNGGR